MADYIDRGVTLSLATPLCVLELLRRLSLIAGLVCQLSLRLLKQGAEYLDIPKKHGHS